MDPTLIIGNSSPQTEAAYRWLDEAARRLQGLRPESDPRAYQTAIHTTLQQAHAYLEHAGIDDLILVGYLNLAAAEAQGNLALTAVDDSRYTDMLETTVQFCRQSAIAAIEGGSGPACIIFPRLLAILAACYTAAPPRLDAVFETSLKQISGGLEEQRLLQTYEREISAAGLAEARLLAASVDSLPAVTDRRILLAQSRRRAAQAGYLAARAGDAHLAQQAEETLNAIERSLQDPTLPAPIFNLPASKWMQQVKAQPAGQTASQASPAAAQAPLACTCCGFPLNPTARFCKNCGTPVSQPTPAPAPLVTTCPNCGQPVRPGVNFCKSCGSKLPPFK